VQARPPLDITNVNAGQYSALTPIRLPRQNARVSRWILCIDSRAGSASAVNYEVRHSATLCRIRRTAKATPLVDHEAVEGYRTVSVQLRELTSKLFVVSDGVDHANLDRRA